MAALPFGNVPHEGHVLKHVVRELKREDVRSNSVPACVVGSSAPAPA